MFTQIISSALVQLLCTIGMASYKAIFPACCAPASQIYIYTDFNGGVQNLLVYLFYIFTPDFRVLHYASRIVLDPATQTKISKARRHGCELVLYGPGKPDAPNAAVSVAKKTGNQADALVTVGVGISGALEAAVLTAMQTA